MVRVWVAGKTVWSPCYTRAISERFRDKELIIKRCINSPSLLCFTFCTSRKTVCWLPTTENNLHPVLRRFHDVAYLWPNFHCLQHTHSGWTPQFRIAKKLETSFFRVMQSRFRYLEPSRRDTTDRHSDSKCRAQLRCASKRSHCTAAGRCLIVT